MRQGTPKMAQLAQKRAWMVQNGSTWCPFLPTLEALLATWDIPLRTFAHFSEVFANSFAFLLKINEKLRKNHKITPKNINFTEKDPGSLLRPAEPFLVFLDAFFVQV